MTRLNQRHSQCTWGDGNGDTVSLSDAAVGDTETRVTLHEYPDVVVAAETLNFTGLQSEVQP